MAPAENQGTGDATGDATARTECSNATKLLEPRSASASAFNSNGYRSISGGGVVEDLQGKVQVSGNEKYPELDNLFALHATIGRGGFSTVKVATDLHSGSKVAIKIVDKEEVGAELPRIDLEVETLQPLSHPHICKLFSVISSSRNIFMIMEYCPTDLYEHIVNNEDRLPVDEARRIFIQLLAAVSYLHLNGIVHRDLKPENVLLDDKLKVKLTDFGLCSVPGKSRINKPTLKTLCGSPAYCAPELLRGPPPYTGCKVDVWSLGVLLYVLLVRELPFYSKNVKELYSKIQVGWFKIPDWLSDTESNLISLMLEPNVNLRPSLHRLWSHPFIQDGELDNFEEQINESQHQVEIEIRTQARYSIFPSRIRNCRFTVVPTDNNGDNVVQYIESSGGDTAMLTGSGSSTSCEERNGNNPLISNKIEKCVQSTQLSRPPQLSSRSEFLGWIRHSFKKTQTFLGKCLFCGKGNDVGLEYDGEELSPPPSAQ